MKRLSLLLLGGLAVMAVAACGGKKPETTPTMERMTNEIAITPMEACRKIAPSWSAVL